MVKLVFKKEKKRLIDDSVLISLIKGRKESGLSTRELAKKRPDITLDDAVVLLYSLFRRGFTVHKWSPCSGDHAVQESRYWLKEEQK